jgi:uncharacterized protein (TIGR02246 family)
MKRIKLILTISTMLLTAYGKEASSQNIKNNLNMKTETENIKELLFNYRDALNESSTEKVMKLYTNEGVFMPSSAPTAIGSEQLKSAYDFVFKNIQLSIEFYIDEIQIVDNYAFVRSTSKGSTLIHANGQTIPEENREIFVLKKVSGNWKIDRYMFNKMK